MGETPSGSGLIRAIPWVRVKEAVRLVRLHAFTGEWPGYAPSVVLDALPRHLEEELRNEHGFEGAPYSYRYEDEKLNLRAPWGTDSSGRALELHVRARRVSGGTEVNAHIEYSRYEQKRRHIDEDMVDWKEGLAAFESLIGRAGTHV